MLDEFQTHRPYRLYRDWPHPGDLKTGVMLGGTLELIALGWMNVGQRSRQIRRWPALSPPFW